MSPARRWLVPAVVGLGLVLVLLVLLVPRSAPRASNDPTPTTTGSSRVTAAPVSTGTATPAEPCNDDRPEWRSTAVRKQTLTHVSGTSFDGGIRPVGPFGAEAVKVLHSTVSLPADALPITRDQVFASVRAEHRLQVADLGTDTNPNMIDVAGVKVDDDEYRDLAAYVGRVQWTGTWSYRWCADQQWRRASGRWTGFELKSYSGVAVCTVGKKKNPLAYRAGSWPARACRNVFL